MPNIRSSIAEADATLENMITKKRSKENRKRKQLNDGRQVAPGSDGSNGALMLSLAGGLRSSAHLVPENLTAVAPRLALHLLVVALWLYAGAP